MGCGSSTTAALNRTQPRPSMSAISVGSVDSTSSKARRSSLLLESVGKHRRTSAASTCSITSDTSVLTAKLWEYSNAGGEPSDSESLSSEAIAGQLSGLHAVPWAVPLLVEAKKASRRAGRVKDNPDISRSLRGRVQKAGKCVTESLLKIPPVTRMRLAASHGLQRTVQNLSQALSSLALFLKAHGPSGALAKSFISTTFQAQLQRHDQDIIEAMGQLKYHLVKHRVSLDWESMPQPIDFSPEAVNPDTESPLLQPLSWDFAERARDAKKAVEQVKEGVAGFIRRSLDARPQATYDPRMERKLDRGASIDRPKRSSMEIIDTWKQSMGMPSRRASMDVGPATRRGSMDMAPNRKLKSEMGSKNQRLKSEAGTRRGSMDFSMPKRGSLDVARPNRTSMEILNSWKASMEAPTGNARRGSMERGSKNGTMDKLSTIHDD